MICSDFLFLHDSVFIGSISGNLLISSQLSNLLVYNYSPWGLPSGSDSKESDCNVGDPGLIPESGRSPGEGNGNPLQCSCLENFMDGETWWVARPWGCKESDTTEWLTHTHNYSSLLWSLAFLCISCKSPLSFQILFESSLSLARSLSLLCLKKNHRSFIFLLSF